MVPLWLHLLAIASLTLGFACAALIAIAELRDPQHMWIMNLVWPTTALFGTGLALWAYLRYGRLDTRSAMAAAEARGADPPGTAATPFPAMVGKGTTHCGAGCTLGDICAEWLVFFVPAIAAGLGYGSLFGRMMFAVWIVDYVFAFGFGILFQYFTIVPMRGLSPGRGLIEAVKADALSLTAWQVGMYGFMAFAALFLFEDLMHAPLETGRVEFWFMMQLAMLVGFATSYPVNWWLLRRGIKEPM